MEMKAQGSGSAVWTLVGMLVAVYCCSLLASSATLTVGGSQGWTIGPNYATWAAGQTFKIGDVLFFSYAQGAHDVDVVNESDYTACTTSSPIATYSAGNTNVTLTSSGAHYFLCSFPGHCTAGMKLAVTVGGGATPAPSPVGTPPPTPATTAPAPATKSPTATPVPSPVRARTPAPASTPTPAPTPLSPSPASAPTPSSPEPPSASSPPSPGAPGSATTAPPPSAAPSITASSALAAILLGLSGALLAL